MRHFTSYRWAGAAVTALGLFATAVVGQPPRPVDPLDAAKTYQKIAEDKVGIEIDQTIKSVDSDVRGNRTEKAISTLKAAKRDLQFAQGISDEARSRFTAKLEAKLAAVQGRAPGNAPPGVKLDPKGPEMRSQKDERAVKYFTELRDVRDGIKAVEQAELDKDAARTNAEIARLTKAYPSNPSVIALNQGDSMKSRLADAQAFYAENNRRWVANQKNINESSLPAIRDVEFPANWKKLSEMRLKSSGLQPTEKEKKIIEALDKPITVAFTERPLEEALQDLSNVFDQPLLIDKKSLEDLGLDLKKGVSLQAKGLSARTALRAILATQGLTFVVKDEVIQIVTVERSKTLLTTRVYYIGDLVQAGQYSGIEWGPFLNAQQKDMNLTTIFDAIRKTDPLSWSGRDTGGPGTITYHAPTQSIIVRNSAEVHFALGKAFGLSK